VLRIRLLDKLLEQRQAVLALSKLRSRFLDYTGVFMPFRSALQLGVWREQSECASLP
jgi:hypothetical protein